MRKLLLSTVLVSALVGCGNNKCEELKTKLCEGLDETTCKAIKDALDHELAKGPTGEKMSDGEKDLGCKMILENKEVLEAYRKATQAKAGKDK